MTFLSYLSKFRVAFPLNWFFNWMKCVHAMIPGNWDRIIMKHNRWATHRMIVIEKLLPSFVVAATFVIFPRFSRLVSLFKKCGSRHPVVRLYWNIYQHLNLKEMYEHVSVNTTIGNPGKTRFFFHEKKIPILSTKQNYWNLFMYVKSR